MARVALWGSALGVAFLVVGAFRTPAVGAWQLESAFAGRRVFLVFTQAGCKPCHAIAPELNRLHDASGAQVLVVNNGEAEAAGRWAAEVKARFPVLAQRQFGVSRRYETFATPFAFLIDEKGVIVSRGIITSAQHIGFVLRGARGAGTDGPAEAEAGHREEGESVEAPSHIPLGGTS
jgi:hypothetical protein